jgi:hypothetical protein
MCGRFTRMYTWRELVALYRLTDPSPPSNLQPRYNICPTTQIDAVVEREGKRTLEQMRWGLIPSWWSKSLKEMNLATFNARAETVASKPMFRSAFKRNRCIIPASGYYEWQTLVVQGRPGSPRPREGSRRKTPREVIHLFSPVILMSMSHEYGYFWVIGRQFQTFLTTSDYFNNAVLWLPGMAIVLWGYLDWDVLLGKRTLAPPGFNLPGAIVFLIIFSFPVFGFFYLAPDFPYTYLMPFVLLWLAYGPRIFPVKEPDPDLIRHAKRAFVIVPVLAVMLFAWGISQAQTDLKSTDEPYTLEMKRGAPLVRNILRTFDKGILVRDTVYNQIEFVNWDEVSQITRFKAPLSEEPLSCSWLHLNCFNRNAVP